MKILVVGGNFAGSTAAMEIKRKLKEKAEVTLIDRNEDFVYIPSLIWVPIKRREISEIVVPRRAVLEKKGVKFVKDTAIKVEPDENKVYCENGIYEYDQLIIATGPKVNFDIAPGIRENCSYIGTPPKAMETREKLEEFKKNPGAIVIGATQNAGCMGAAYEFLFNIEKWLREQNIRKKVDLYWVTPEPYLGHFGIDGMPLGETMLKTFMQMFKIHYRTGVGIKEVEKEKVILSTGEEIESKFTMLMPPFVGVDFIANSPKLETPPNNFIPILPNYRHQTIKNIWGAGLAVDVKPPFKQGEIPFTIPKTGYPSDVTGKIVAKNIIKTIEGKTDFVEKSWGRIPGLCVMDAGKKEVLLVSNSLFKPRVFAIMVPNVFYDISKILLEKYFLWKLRNGYSSLL
ncbi:NAD(P)/FAD-dependent oxidoreductase [Candidatus Kaistella beijingensis]|uniref:NAD(P)/FAD-dependent oxidoreductase n=1 Tax=Candidatus Kaistella beijingensis TaxID=2820270 RepID=UPI001CC62606|nr:FAD/NAD(P)-binding oxidoreductase [Candidatus Kaistella beijingensis]UBB90379.1 NAD(P)/FAD-dependent oxidoreductase [Candidatus Kaistella beijingensis]